MRFRIINYLSIFLLPSFLYCQLDTSWQEAPTINFWGYTELFYIYDFNEPEQVQRQSFLFAHNRHHEFNLNIGLIGMELEHSKYRGRFAIHTGTYSEDNYAAEPGVLKNIYEAQIGLSLNRRNTLWLDAGIFPSHIGFESAITSDNWTLTRSLAAENSPYYLAGAKMTWTPNENWEALVVVCNGWQLIQRVSGNSLLSLGTQLIYRPTSKSMFAWSTFIGTDDPDEQRRMRYFNSAFGQFEVSPRFNVVAGFDIGWQEMAPGSSEYHSWIAPTIVGQFLMNDTWSTALRFEYFGDSNGVIIPTSNGRSFKTTGLSWNIDYAPNPLLMCRMETRLFTGPNAIFDNGADFSKSNFFWGASVALKFETMSH